MFRIFFYCLFLFYFPSLVRSDHIELVAILSADCFVSVVSAVSVVFDFSVVRAAFSVA